MYLKFANTKHPIRTPLLKMVSNPNLSGPSIRAGWSRTVGNLRKVGVALTPNPPVKPLTNHKRKNIVKGLRKRLMHDHTKALTLAKATVALTEQLVPAVNWICSISWLGRPQMATMVLLPTRSLLSLV